MGAAAVLSGARDQMLPYPKEPSSGFLAPTGSSGSHFGTTGAMGVGQQRIGRLLPDQIQQKAIKEAE